MKSASSSNAILSFFSQHGLYFYPTKDRCLTRPTSTFLYICCNFGQIFCTNLIQFFSVQNMGHDQLIKCSKYHLVSLLDLLLVYFCHFGTLFYPSVPLNQQCSGSQDYDPDKKVKGRMSKNLEIMYHFLSLCCKIKYI